jgi:hypothetical protein
VGADSLRAAAASERHRHAGAAAGWIKSAYVVSGFSRTRRGTRRS